MSIYTIEYEGKKYKIDAEDENSAYDALAEHVTPKEPIQASTSPSIPSPSPSTMDDISTGAQLALKSVPIVGNGIPETDAMKSFKERHPYIDAGIKTGVPLAANAAVAFGTGGLSIPEQLALYGGIGAADKLTSKGMDTTAKDLLGAVGGNIAGVGFGKVLGKTVDTALPNVIDKLSNPALTASIYSMNPMAILSALGGQLTGKALATETAKKVIDPVAQGIGASTAQYFNKNGLPNDVKAQLDALGSAYAP